MANDFPPIPKEFAPSDEADIPDYLIKKPIIKEPMAVPISPVAITPQIDRVLTNAINKIGQDKRGQFSFDLNTKGGLVEIGQKYGEHWVVSAYAAHEWGTRKTEAGVRVRGSW